MSDRSRLVIYGKLLSSHGLVIGAGGNISCRAGKHMIIKKSGVDMSAASEEDYVEVPFGDLPLEPATRLSSEASLHAGSYSCDESINAVVHTHSPYAIAAANKTAEIKNISYEFECLLGGKTPVLGPVEPGSTELRDTVCKALGEGFFGVILKKHGPVTVGKSLEEAFLRALAIERACLVFINS